MTPDSSAPDQFAVLSAIWILACNDETPLITYRSVRRRLNLAEDYDVEGLVRNHGELFRLRIPPSRLKAWQEDMLNENHMPSWVRETTGSVRTQLINSLKPRTGSGPSSGPKQAHPSPRWRLLSGD